MKFSTPSIIMVIAISVATMNCLAQTKTNIAVSQAGVNPGGSAVQAPLNHLWLVEEARPVTKGSTATQTPNTFRLEPTGQSFYGPIRVCLKYAAGDNQGVAATKLTYQTTARLNEIRDKNGKANYSIVPAYPEDDKLNSQLCMYLKSF